MAIRNADLRNKVKILLYPWVTLVLLTILAFSSTIIQSKKASGPSPTSKPIAIATTMPTWSPSPMATAKPKTLGATATATVDPDPITNCNISANCGGGTRKMKTSECNNSTCCQIGSGWYFYPTKQTCTDAQKANIAAANNQNNYPPCSVYYPVLGYSQTYYYVSPETCNSWNQQAASFSEPIPTYQPSPTVDPIAQQQYNDLLQQHEEACNQAVAEWIGIKEQFNTNEYYNYSSSAEATYALIALKDQYQAELYSAGCTQTISIY